MEFAYDLSGGAPVLKRYKLGATTARGVILLNTAANGAGLAQSTTTSTANAVGLAQDAGTYSTTQGDAEGIATVLINPLAVYRLRMNDGATEGTALAVVTNSAASAGGTVVTITTGDDAPNSPEMDEGTLVCITGANVGQTRKITSTDGTTATATVPFPNAIAVGDEFILVPWTPVDVAGNNIQVTTALTEANRDIAVGTGAAFRVVELEFDVSSRTNARNKSYVYATLDDHIFNATT